MAQSEQELEAQRRQMAQGQPGGGTSRGPETATTPTTEAQGLVPPYDREESPAIQAASAEGVHKAFNADTYGGEPGPAPVVSTEERDGADYTDMPMGVKGDRRASGEELTGKGRETGRQDTGPQGPTDRPAGVSTGADVTGINPSQEHTHQNEAPTDPDDTAHPTVQDHNR